MSDIFFFSLAEVDQNILPTRKRTESVISEVATGAILWILLSFTVLGFPHAQV